MTKLSFTITLHDKSNYLYDRNIFTWQNINLQNNFFVYMTIKLDLFENMINATLKYKYNLAHFFWDIIS